MACLASTASALTALRLMPAAFRLPVGIQRSRTLVAYLRHGWALKTDQSSGQTYYYNEVTGHSQWEPPQAVTAQTTHGAHIHWAVVPVTGVLNQYTVRRGEHQVLGRYDMASQNPYISEFKCVVRVDATSGTATLVALGDAPIAVCKPEKGLWFDLRKKQTHVLSDGERIALDGKNPEGIYGAIFAVYSQPDEYGYAVQQDGWGQQAGCGEQGGWEQQGGWA